MILRFQVIYGAFYVEFVIKFLLETSKNQQN